MEAQSHGPALKQVPEPIRPLARIVCGVDGSRSAMEGVRQAAELARPQALLELLAVTDESGFGPYAEATLDPRHADTALDQALRIADELGVNAEAREVHADIAADALLAEASDADLLVLASHGHTRLGGIMIGSTASRALHSAALPVLVARALARGQHVLDHVVVACGGPCGTAAVAFTERLGPERIGKLTLFRVDGHRDPLGRPELSVEKARLTEALGFEPVEVVHSGSVVDQILGFAKAEGASLVVCGSRGLRHGSALLSVSERVAHRAPCSVLVVRPPVQTVS